MALNIKSEQIKSPRDKVVWLFVLLLIAALAVANYYFSDQSAPLRMTWSLLALIVILALASFTEKGKRFWIFAKESKIELRKVVWPTRQETIRWTIMIVVVVVVMALFLWGVDSILLWGVRFFTGQRG